MKVSIGKKYDVVTWNTSQTLKLEDILKMRTKTLLYFYPKDNTPGCTMESKDFTCLKQKFDDLWIQIVGVSKDDVESHKKFIASEGLDLVLVSDISWELHNEFWVIGEKNMYGKISVWVIRSTFLLDDSWKVLKEWRNVKATGHAEKVLREVS